MSRSFHILITPQLSYARIVSDERPGVAIAAVWRAPTRAFVKRSQCFDVVTDVTRQRTRANRWHYVVSNQLICLDDCLRDAFIRGAIGDVRLGGD